MGDPWHRRRFRTQMYDSGYFIQMNRYGYLQRSIGKEDTVSIHASIETVFAYLTHFCNTAKWYMKSDGLFSPAQPPAEKSPDYSVINCISHHIRYHFSYIGIYVG